jgi:hypothetical protein
MLLPVMLLPVMLLPVMLLPVMLLLFIPSTSAGYRRAEVESVVGRYLYWPERRIAYVVNERGCSDVPMSETLGAIERAFAAWAEPPCTDLSFVYEGIVPDDGTNLTLEKGSPPDNQNLIVWGETWPPAGAGTISTYVPGLTTLLYDVETGQIMDADIDLNAQNFFWTTTDDPGQAATDIQNILTHEIGHLLGLTHSKEREATMYENTHQGEMDKRSLHADDELGICTVYPIGQSTPEGHGQGTLPGGEGGCSLGSADQAHISWWPGMLLLLVCLLGIKACAS